VLVVTVLVVTVLVVTVLVVTVLVVTVLVVTVLARRAGSCPISGVDGRTPRVAPGAGST
jgi:hypothetical protein